MSRQERWGIFLLGPLGEERRYCVVRAACYISARTLANTELGGTVVDGDQVGWDSAPAEIVGDALIDQFPRVLLSTHEPVNLVAVTQRGTGGTDGWLYTYMGYGIRRARDGEFNVESMDRKYWHTKSGFRQKYCGYDGVNDPAKDTLGIFKTYEEAKQAIPVIIQRSLR